jgi:Brp/Blh family beta-carotene 15,15'-monooxygenase
MHKTSRLAGLAFAAAAVLALRMLESTWPQLSWMVFFALTLSLGFAHGVLDVILLRHALPRSRVFFHFAIYGAAVLLVLAAAWGWPAMALLALLLLSVWHFGQELHPLRLARAALGGAAVMWPLIVQPQAMQALLAQTFAQDAWLVQAWQGLAWGWLLLLIASLIRHWPHSSARNRLLLESAALALLYGMLTPWLAFALYFSLFHSAAHIRRVWQASGAAQVQWRAHRVGLLMTALLTLALMLCAGWLFALTDTAAVLQSAWTLPAWVALVTAVTVPHGLLVGLAWPWLQQAKRS